MNFLLAPWHYTFMQHGFLAVIMVGITCSTLGCFVVLRRMAFVGDAMSHTILPGVVIAYLAKVDLFIGAMIAALCTAAGIGWLSKRQEIREDTAIGVLFTGMFAFGVLLIAQVQSFRDFSAMLIGYPTGVSPSDLMVMAAILLLVVTLLALFFKELELTSVDPEYASVIGLRASWMRNLLLFLLALSVVTGIQAVGVIMISGLLITPAATASLITRNLLQMMILSAILSVIAGVSGLYASFYENLSAGASIVLTATLMFSLAFIGRSLARRR